ncbi:MAG: DUF541 domain-containing protein [Chloroflexi bacterium]|nr:DUF541 domain-containing protein [Chloroflexota bacterium]
MSEKNLPIKRGKEGNMKSKVLLLIAGLVLAVSLVLVGCGESNTSTAGAQGSQVLLASGNSQQTGIWVSGTGKVMGAPDVAILTLGVEAQEKTVSEAQSKAAKAMSDIVAALKANGVADKDIQTQWYTISVVTKWDKDTEEQIVVGYRVTNMVTAKLRDINKAGTIIDAVALAGGDLTRVEGISFTIDDPTSYFNQARQEAMEDAEAKAQQMADLAGVGLGKAFYISESGGYIPQPYPVKDYYSFAEGSGSTPISAGELEITLTVQVAYAID